jgi:hypothetical protein
MVLVMKLQVLMVLLLKLQVLVVLVLLLLLWEMIPLEEASSKEDAPEGAAQTMACRN